MKIYQYTNDELNTILTSAMHATIERLVSDGLIQDKGALERWVSARACVAASTDSFWRRVLKVVCPSLKDDEMMIAIAKIETQ